jgi:phage gpG-like protein
MTLKLKMDLSDAHRRVRVFLTGMRERTKSEIAPMTQRASEAVRDSIQTEIRRRLNKRPTGKLEKSFDISIRVTRSGQVTALIGSTLPYARIHEAGGIIRPVRARMLTIPLTDRARKLPARQWGRRLFKLRGKPLLASRGGRGGGTQAQFVLRHSVTIPARRYISAALARVTPRLERILGRSVQKVVGR